MASKERRHINVIGHKHQTFGAQMFNRKRTDLNDIAKEVALAFFTASRSHMAGGKIAPQTDLAHIFGTICAQHKDLTEKEMKHIFFKLVPRAVDKMTRNLDRANGTVLSVIDRLSSVRAMP
jgi:hypothetical protein